MAEAMIVRLKDFKGQSTDNGLKGLEYLQTGNDWLCLEEDTPLP